jgi:hypothetical protein
MGLWPQRAIAWMRLFGKASRAHGNGMVKGAEGIVRGHEDKDRRGVVCLQGPTEGGVTRLQPDLDEMLDIFRGHIGGIEVARYGRGKNLAVLLSGPILESTSTRTRPG